MLRSVALRATQTKLIINVETSRVRDDDCENKVRRRKENVIRTQYEAPYKRSSGSSVLILSK